MPVAVVDVFEMVHIQIKNRERSLISFRPPEGLFEPVGEQIAVGQGGEEIVSGNVFQSGFFLFEIVDLAGDPHQANNLPGRAAQREFGGGSPVLFPVLVLVLLHQSNDGHPALHHPQIIHAGSLSKFLAEQLDIRFADELGRVAEPERQRHFAAGPDNAAVAVLKIDAVGSVFHQGSEQIIFIEVKDFFDFHGFLFQYSNFRGKETELLVDCNVTGFSRNDLHLDDGRALPAGRSHL